MKLEYWRGVAIGTSLSCLMVVTNQNIALYVFNIIMVAIFLLEWTAHNVEEDK